MGDRLHGYRCLYNVNRSRRALLRGFKEALWHSVSHTLSIDVFRVNSFCARIVTVAYAFLVMIITNTYTANLAAFLTVSKLDTAINTVDDLRGKRLLTIDTYSDRIWHDFSLDSEVQEGV